MEEEYKSYPVRIRVVSQKGWCGMCHKVGDEWIYVFEPGKPPNTPNICESALHAMFCYLRVLWFDGKFPWPTPDPDTIRVACPDAANPVVFELKRLRDQPIYPHYDSYSPELKD